MTLLELKNEAQNHYDDPEWLIDTGYNILGQDLSDAFYQFAIELFNKALELSPDNPDAIFNRGRAFTYLGDYEQAMQDYSFVIDKNVKTPFPYLRRGELYLKLNNLEKAVEDFNKSISIAGHPQAFYKRGLAYRKLGEFNLAIDDFTKTINYDYYWYESVEYRGDCYNSLNNFEKAIEDYSLMLEDNINNRDNILGKRAVCYIELGMMQDASQDVKEGLDFNGNNELLKQLLPLIDNNLN